MPELREEAADGCFEMSTKKKGRLYTFAFFPLQRYFSVCAASYTPFRLV